MTDWPFSPFLPGQYRVIYADPPWKFSAGGKRNPKAHYPTMPLRDIAAMPIGKLAHPEGCRLLMWVTRPILLLPFGPREVMKAWGFRYSTCRIWGKLWPRETGMFIYPDSMSRGSGFEVNDDAEILIIAKRGRPARVPPGKQPKAFFFGARRREHSRKPDFLRDEIAGMFEGPRIELFSRTEHPGFDHWGNEAGKFAEVA